MIRVSSIAIIAAATLALSLAGCKKKDANAGDDCAVAVNHMMDVQLADLSSGMDPKTKAEATAAITKAKAALIASCKQTKWSKDATDCIKAVKNDDDAAKCDEKLTKEQRDAADKVVDVDSDEPAGSAGSAAAGGSAAGSAAAGGTAEAGAAAGSAAASGSGGGGSAAGGSAAAGSAAGGSAAAGSGSGGAM